MTQGSLHLEKECTNAPEGEVTPEFRIALVCENESLGNRAMQVCEALGRRFNGQFMFRVASQRFDELESESRFEETLAGAANADMIFVGSAGRLPATLFKWLHECIERRRHDAPVALVDFTCDEAANTDEIHRWLGGVAQTHHLHLIRPEQFAPLPEKRSTSASPWLGRNYVRHFGINE